MPQRQYRRRCASGVDHVYDVHSRVARAPSVVHSLLIACVHRVAHHNDSPQLVWLHDIHALAGRMTAGEWREFESLAETRNVRAACWRGLTLAAQAFGTPLPPQLLDRLALGRADPSSAFIGRRKSGDRRAVVELAAPAWLAGTPTADRGALLPSPSYMMARYGLERRVWLPVWYVRRAVAGALRWLRPTLP